ncbi:hypothetical protein Tco_0593630 [Tanacetum coccineum]
MNKQVVESNNEIRSDIEDVLPEVANPYAVMEEIETNYIGTSKDEVKLAAYLEKLKLIKRNECWICRILLLRIQEM